MYSGNANWGNGNYRVIMPLKQRTVYKGVVGFNNRKPVELKQRKENGYIMVLFIVIFVILFMVLICFIILMKQVSGIKKNMGGYNKVSTENDQAKVWFIKIYHFNCQ